MPSKSKDESKVLDIVALKSKEKNSILKNSAKKKTSASQKASKISNKKSTKKDSKSSFLKPEEAKKKTSSKKDVKTEKINENKIKENRKINKNANNRRAQNKKKINYTNIEYYDLPYRYNETTVKILAQTPTMLFIYWDISDSDRSSYINKYGKEFFNNTRPVLIVTNKTKNYSFEVEINDFANSWYLQINDADCDYVVELGRRPINTNSNIDNYICVSASNDMEMPNNHVLFDKLGKSLFFKNVKNNFVEGKEITSLSFIRNLGKAYSILSLYKEIYKDEIDVNKFNNTENIRLNLPSSSSSTFK